MSYESNTGLNVSNHYGPRAVGGTDGCQVTSDSRRIYVLDIDADKPEFRTISVTQDGIAESVYFEGTAGTAAVLIGATDITAAVPGTPVAFTAGNLTVTPGTGTGKVKVTLLLKEA